MAQEEFGVYGYRKLHDDLLDQGETCCPNRVNPVRKHLRNAMLSPAQFERQQILKAEGV